MIIGNDIIMGVNPWTKKTSLFRRSRAIFRSAGGNRTLDTHPAQLDGPSIASQEIWGNRDDRDLPVAAWIHVDLAHPLPAEQSSHRAEHALHGDEKRGRGQRFDDGKPS